MIMMVMVLNKTPKPGRAPPIASWQERRHDDDALMTPTLSLSTPKWDQIWMKIEGIAQNIEKAQQNNLCTIYIDQPFWDFDIERLSFFY